MYRASGTPTTRVGVRMGTKGVAMAGASCARVLGLGMVWKCRRHADVTRSLLGQT
jgi:hypothetical protein